MCPRSWYHVWVEWPSECDSGAPDRRSEFSTEGRGGRKESLSRLFFASFATFCNSFKTVLDIHRGQQSMDKHAR